MDGNGFSPIMWAASYGQLPTVRLLIQNRAKVDMEVGLGEGGEEEKGCEVKIRVWVRVKGRCEEVGGVPPTSFSWCVVGHG